MRDTMVVWEYTDDAEFETSEPCWHTSGIVDDCVWCQRVGAETARAASEKYWRARLAGEYADDFHGWVLASSYERVCEELARMTAVVGEMTIGNKRITSMYRNRRRRVTRLIEECRGLYKERRETRSVLRKIIGIGGEYSVFSGSAEETLAFIKDLVSDFYKATTRDIRSSVGGEQRDSE